jgi:hypothetical protein
MPVEAVIKCLLRVHWRGVPTVVAQSDEAEKWLARYNEEVDNTNHKNGALNKITESSSSSSSDVEQEALAALRESFCANSKLIEVQSQLDDAAWFWSSMRRRDIKFSNWDVSLEGPGPEGPFRKFFARRTCIKRSWV